MPTPESGAQDVSLCMGNKMCSSSCYLPKESVEVAVVVSQRLPGYFARKPGVPRSRFGKRLPTEKRKEITTRRKTRTASAPKSSLLPPDETSAISTTWVVTHVTCHEQRIHHSASPYDPPPHPLLQKVRPRACSPERRISPCRRRACPTGPLRRRM